jgi:chromate transporter
MDKTPMSGGSDPAELVKPSFGEAFKFWLKLGFISFGGPAGQIAIMHRELVERKKWVDEKSFLHALNFCMLLPGPEAQQLATYSGWRLHGIRGGIVAGAFFVIPSVFLLLILSYVYARYGDVRWVAGVLDGFKPIVVAIVVEAVIKIGRRAFSTIYHLAIAVAAFVAIQFLGIPFPLIVIVAALAGLFFLRTAGEPEVSGSNNTVAISILKPLKVLAVCFALWLIPLILSVSIYGRESLAVKIYLFFTQAAFVTFGGAYAVLAYVNQAVVGAGWITSVQAVDALALAETTPGPLIMVTQFVGFMAGWNNPGTMDPMVFAIVCALLTTFATFLPSFLFIFAGAPYIERLYGNRLMTASLSGVTAAVVGVILNLALVFGTAVVVTEAGIDLFSVVLGSVALFALTYFKADVLLVIAAGGLIGFLRVLILG